MGDEGPGGVCVAAVEEEGVVVGASSFAVVGGGKGEIYGIGVS